jgi:S1-C subfamily serine protease
MKVRQVVLRVSLGVLALVEISSWAWAGGPEDSVVRVTSMIRLPNPLRPWIRQNAAEVGGTGVVIAGKRILTNAHLVLYAEEIYVQPGQGGDRVEAKVAAIGPGIDLAVLTIDPSEGDFFAKRPPLPEAGALPEVSSRVVLKGFPVGGASLSTTQGIVSRIDYAYYEGGAAGLRVQVDAQAGPGSSGGPALVDGKMVGLVFGFGQVENSGFLIPNEEIDDFLADVADGRYDGKPALHEQWQTLENDALRAKLGLTKATRGIMVREPRRRESTYPLREFDVVTTIGDKPVDNEGMVQIRDNLRLSFMYLVPKLVRDGTVPLRVFRSGQEREVRVPADRHADRLFRRYDGRQPSYFVCGSLVFSPVMADAASLYFRYNPSILGRNTPIVTRSTDRARFPGEELVVVTAPFLPHKITKGYSEPLGQVVEAVNGTKIRSLCHLVEFLRDCKDEFLTIRFAEDGSETLVFRRKALLDTTEPLMSQNGIPRRASEDALRVWDAKSVAASR